VFCQNHEISRAAVGEEVSPAKLREIFLRLRDEGVHNINLVTPSHYVHLIAEVLSGLELGIPVVWNSSGYDSARELRALEGLVQVYMPDLKYSDAALARRYSQAGDYPLVALAAIKEMYRQTGPFTLDEEGIMQRGVLIRHLILPGSAENTLGVIDMVEDNLPADKIMFSLMSQYTPMPGCEAFHELQRRVTEEEYERCCSYLDFSGIEFGYCQDLESATGEMIPDFDGTGVE
jgi:putative pyruvate formate lyase activating enzyme